MLFLINLIPVSMLNNRDTRLTLIFLALIVLVAVILTAWVRLQSPTATTDTEISSPSEPIRTHTYTTLSGEPYRVADDPAQYTLMYSWASWCPSCAKELPILAALAAETDTEQVSFVFINRAEVAARATEYLASVAPEVLDAPVSVVLDDTDHFYQQSGTTDVPVLTILDQSGAVVYQHQGVLVLDEVRTVVTELSTNSDQ